MHNLIAHALIHNEKGEILIIRRTMIKRGKKNFEGGKWDIPGGTVEALELPSEAAIRETCEEVGLDVYVEKILYEKSNVDQEKQKVFTTLIYSCKVKNNKEVQLDLEEHDSYRWVQADDVKKIDDSEVVSYMKELFLILNEGEES